MRRLNTYGNHLMINSIQMSLSMHTRLSYCVENIAQQHTYLACGTNTEHEASEQNASKLNCTDCHGNTGCTTFTEEREGYSATRNVGSLCGWSVHCCWRSRLTQGTVTVEIWHIHSSFVTPQCCGWESDFRVTNMPNWVLKPLIARDKWLGQIQLAWEGWVVSTTKHHGVHKERAVIVLVFIITIKSSYNTAIIGVSYIQLIGVFAIDSLWTLGVHLIELLGGGRSYTYMHMKTCW